MAYEVPSFFAQNASHRFQGYTSLLIVLQNFVNFPIMCTITIEETFFKVTVGFGII